MKRIARTSAVTLIAVTVALGVVAGPAAAASPTAGAAPGPSTDQFDVVTATDIPVTMPDGRILRARVDAPVDRSTGKPAAGPFPVILSETPYGKTLQPSIPATFVQHGYIAATVDVAGTGGSQGQSQLFGDSEARDSVHVIDWAAALPHSTGKVGMYGGSYLAIDQLFAAAAVGPNSPLKAIFPIDASVDPYRDLFTSGGVVNVESSLGLIAAYFGLRTLSPLLERGTDPADAVQLAIQHALAGAPFELTVGLDAALNGPRRFWGDYWRERAPETVLPNIVRNGVAAYLVGGQYDVFQRGEPLLYSQLQNVAAGRPQFAPMTAGQPVTSKYQLLFGPWDHSTAGGTDLINATALRWFDQWLKGVDTGILDTRAPLHIVEPGGAHYDATSYPNENATVRRYYLGPQHGLSTTAPGTDGGSDTLLFTGLSQPCTRSTQQWSAGAIPASVCGATEPAALPEPTQLTYTSAPVTTATKLAGPIGVTLNATSLATDTLFAVTVEDVAPDGSATALSSGAQLGSLRAIDTARSWPDGSGGYTLPYHPLTQQSQQSVPLLTPTRYDIEVRPVFATLAPGHRLRVQLGTGDLPHLLVPPTQLLSLAGASFINHSAAQLSWIDLPVVK